MSALVSFTLLAPLLSSFTFFIIENRLHMREKLFTKRTIIYSGFGLLAIAVSLFISNFLMNPLIYFYGYFDTLSISNIQSSAFFTITITFLSLDLANYLIHRLIHFLSFLWRFHRLHHSDRELDALSTVLHHPLEVFINSFLIIAVYVVFDLPIFLVITYDILLAIHDAFVHSTISVPHKLERWLGYVFVMPAMHRMHHSLDTEYGNSNFGSIFAFWDRLFGTYVSNEKRTLVFGVEANKSPTKCSVKEFLLNPIC